MECHTIIINLDRRPHRWWKTLGALCALNFDNDNITRYSAHDAENYHNNLAAWEAGTHRYPESRYLTELRLPRGHYCYAYTWYEMMTEISRANSSSHYLILLDDCYPTITYHEFIDHICSLNDLHNIKLIQFAPRYPKKFEMPHEMPQSCFYDNMCLGGDLMYVVTPAGAHDLLDVADRPTTCVPDGVIDRVKDFTRDLSGYFSALPHCDFIRHTRGNKYINEPEDSSLGVEEHNWIV